MQIGDKVRVISDDTSFNGRIGTIVDIKKSPKFILPIFVRFTPISIVPFREDELQVIPPKPFTKDDLKDGMICTNRGGINRIVFENHLFCSYVKHPSLNEFNNDLTHITNNNLDIMQITYNNEVVFKREEQTYTVRYKIDKQDIKSYENITSKEKAIALVENLLQNDIEKCISIDLEIK